MSLLNWGAGLSAMGSAIADYSGKVGLSEMKAEQDRALATLTDQLATTREHTGRVEAGDIASTAADKREKFETKLVGVKGAQDIATAKAANESPMTADQAATIGVQKDTLAETTRHNQFEEKKPIASGYSSAWMVPDKNEPTGYKVVSAVGSSAPITIDKNSDNLSEQTGLSTGAINYATGQLKGRTSQQQIAQYNKEINDWAIGNHIDVSTLIPQATATSKTLETNILRNNQANILEHEIDGSIKNSTVIADAMGQGKLRAADLANVWLGKQFNDPTTIQAADQLVRLRDELAGYNAIAGGHLTDHGYPAPTPEDRHAAEATISSGINSGGLKALGESVAMSASKNRAVLQDSIDNAQKQFHALFGAEYHPPKRDEVNPAGSTAAAPAAAVPTAAAPGAPPTVPVGGIPKFSNPEDPAFQALPAGSKFMGPDGTVRIKK